MENTSAQRSPAYIFLKIFQKAKKVRRKQLLLLLLLTLISLMFEMLSVGSLIPFIDALSGESDLNNPENLKFIKIITDYFLPYENKKFILMVIFIFFTIISYLFKIFIIWFAGYIHNNIGHEINLEIFKKTVFKKYYYHINTNSSKFVGNINKSDRFRSAIAYVLQLIISIIMVIGFLVFLIFLDKKLVLLLSVVGIFLYFITYLFLKKKMSAISIVEANEIDNRIRILQETSANIREVLISGLQKKFLGIFKSSDDNLKKILIKNIIYTNIPGNFILMVATILLSILIFFYSNKSGGIISNLPIMAAVIFLLQKMIPQLQFIYTCFSKLKLHSQSLYDVKDLLYSTDSNIETEIIEKKDVSFKKSIKISNGKFSYDINSREILNNINIEIKKNETVLILGNTGSGKSTLEDILIGLISLNSGKLLIDEIEIDESKIFSWQKKISHIPQHASFLDSSILENITFTKKFEDIDEEKLHQVTKIAEIYDFIVESANGFQSIIGERAKKLSGGQKQRIALARALYSDKEVLFLDEATNALDKEMEEKIFTNIFNDKKNKTIIVISHNEDLAKFFDKVLKVEKSEVKQIR